MLFDSPRISIANSETPQAQIPATGLTAAMGRGGSTEMKADSANSGGGHGPRDDADQRGRDRGSNKSTGVQSPTPSPGQLGRPLGTSSATWRHRLLRHHLPLALASCGGFALFVGLATFSPGAYPMLDMGAAGALPEAMGSVRMDDRGQSVGQLFELVLSMRRMTFATGYVALLLLGLTLLIGPANLLLRRRNPVSSYLRRDVGTWTAALSLVHVALGLQVHGGGQLFNVFNYFVRDGRPLTNSFGLGNWTGLAATVIVVGLLALSTDGSMRELRAKRWKNLQRLNYALFALVALHAFFYGALLRATSPFTLILIFVVVGVFVGQFAGIWMWRRRASRTAANQAERQTAGSAQ
jgi:sulfoxide reductase heme-binding subunit YedZ